MHEGVMRDRLIELIKQAERTFSATGRPVLDIEEYVADHLLESGVIVPPCKVGQTVYVLTYDSPTGIEKSRVKRMLLHELQDGTTLKIIVPCVFDDWGKATRAFYPEDFGKTVFLTREKAEAALAERSER